VLRAHTIVHVRAYCVCMVIHTYTTTPLSTVIMAPKCNGTDAGSASKPKRSHDVLSISEKVKILDMTEIEKKIIRGDCQIVWQERIFQSRMDEEHRKNFIALSSLED